MEIKEELGEVKISAVLEVEAVIEDAADACAFLKETADDMGFDNYIIREFKVESGGENASRKI